MAILSGAFFDVYLAGTGVYLSGEFYGASGLNMAFEYETYCEGGSSYPRFFFKEAQPQTLVLERGILTSVDAVSILANMVNSGISVPLAGAVNLMNNLGEIQRIWTIAGAHLVRYVGPSLNGNEPALAVSRIELMYNGCS